MKLAWWIHMDNVWIMITSLLCATAELIQPENSSLESADQDHWPAPFPESEYRWQRNGATTDCQLVNNRWKVKLLLRLISVPILSVN